MNGNCTGCGHLRSRHFRDVDGIVRCLVVERGTSSSGVIGLPWETPCDCADYRSETGDRARAAAEAEQARQQAMAAELARALAEPVDRTQRCTLHGHSPDDPAVREIDPSSGMQKDYVVLCDEERAKGFVRPVRRTYLHVTCGGVTTMGQALAETYARDPGFYGGTFCAICKEHRPVGANGEFVWDDGSGQKVGT